MSYAMNYTLINSTTNLWPNGTLDMTSPAVIASVAASSLATLLGLVAAIITIVKRDAVEFRIAQPRTSFVTYCGLAMMNVAVLLGIQRPMSVDWCMARMWSFQLAAILVMASVVLKAWRLWRLDRNAKMTPVKLSQEGFMSILGIAVVVHLGVLVFWSLIEPSGPGPDGDGCVSDGWIGQAVCIGLLFILWVLWVCWSIATLHLGAQLTETAWASAVVAAAAGLAGVAAAYLGPGPSYLKNGPLFSAIVRQTIESMAAFALTLALVLFGLFPKFVKPEMEYEDEIFDETDRKRTVFRRGSGSTHPSSRGGRGRMNRSTRFSTSASSLSHHTPAPPPPGPPPPPYYYAPPSPPLFSNGSMLGEDSDLIGAIEEPYVYHHRSFPAE